MLYKSPTERSFGHRRMGCNVPFPRGQLTRNNLRGLATMRDVVLFSFLISIYLSGTTTPVDRTLATTGLSQGSLFGQLTLIVFFFVGFVSQLSTPRAWGKIIKSLTPLLPIFLWILLSISWSDFSDISMRRAIRFSIEAISLACFAAAYPDQYRILRIIFLSF